MKIVKLTGGQALKLLLVTVLATEILLLPGIAAQRAGVDAWLVPGVAGALALPVIMVQVRLAAHFPNQTIAQYSPLIVGEFLGRGIGLIYSWFFFHLFHLILRQFSDFMVIVFMPETPMVAFLLVLIVLSISIVRNGLLCLAKTNEFIIVIILGAIFFIVLLIVQELNFEILRPVLAEGPLPVLQAAPVPLVWLAEFAVLLYIFPYVDKAVNKTAIALGGLLFLVILFTGTTTAPLLYFGAEETARIPFPLFSLARIIRLAFLERMEAVVMAIWVGGIFVKASIFLWCATFGLAQTCNLVDHRPLVTPMGILGVPLAILSVENLLQYREFAAKIFPIYGLTIMFGIPLVLVIIVNIRAKLDPTFPRNP